MKLADDNEHIAKQPDINYQDQDQVEDEGVNILGDNENSLMAHKYEQLFN